MSKQLFEIANDFGLEQVVREPTKINNTLDLFFTSNPTLVERSPVGISDHDGIPIVITNCKPRIMRQRSRKIYMYMYLSQSWLGGIEKPGAFRARRWANGRQMVPDSGLVGPQSVLSQQVSWLWKVSSQEMRTQRMHVSQTYECMWKEQSGVSENSITAQICWQQPTRFSYDGEDSCMRQTGEYVLCLWRFKEFLTRRNSRSNVIFQSLNHGNSVILRFITL